MSKQRAWAALFAAVAAVVSWCSGIGDSGQPMVRLVGAGFQSFSGFPTVSPTRHADVGSMIVCASSNRVRIQSVTPVDLTGTIQVVAVRTRPNPFIWGKQGIGAQYGSLASLGLVSNTRSIVRCNKKIDGTGSEVAIEMSVPAGTNAAARGWKISVSDGHGSSSVTYPQGVILCSTPSLDSPTCQQLRHTYGDH